METRHAAYSLAYKTGAIFGGHFGGKNPRLIAEEIRYHWGKLNSVIISQSNSWQSTSLKNGHSLKPRMERSGVEWGAMTAPIPSPIHSILYCCHQPYLEYDTTSLSTNATNSLHLVWSAVILRILRKY